jgi:hypothetical protein
MPDQKLLQIQGTVEQVNLVEISLAALSKVIKTGSLCSGMVITREILKNFP